MTKYNNMVMFTDLHLQDRDRYGGSKFWVELGLSAIDLAHQVSVDHDKTDIVFVGDLFHYKDRHPAWLINATRDRVRASASAGVKWFFLLGNHDIGSRNASIVDVFADIPNVTVVSKPQILEVNKTPCAFVPYMMSTKEIAKQVKKFSKDADIAFLHHGLEKAVTQLGYEFPEGLSEKAIAEYEWVFCGHYHKHQVVFPNALYLGSPYQMDFGERGDTEKGIWFLNAEEGQLETYKVPSAPQFVQMEVDASNTNLFEDVETKGNILKIIVNATRGERATLDIPTWKRWWMDQPDAPMSIIIETKLKEEAKERLKIEEKKFSWESVVKAYSEQQEFSEETEKIGMDVLNSVQERK